MQSKKSDWGRVKDKDGQHSIGLKGFSVTKFTTPIFAYNTSWALDARLTQFREFFIFREKIYNKVRVVSPRLSSLSA